MSTWWCLLVRKTHWLTLPRINTACSLTENSSLEGQVLCWFHYYSFSQVENSKDWCCAVESRLPNLRSPLHSSSVALDIAYLSDLFPATILFVPWFPITESEGWHICHLIGILLSSNKIILAMHLSQVWHTVSKSKHSAASFCFDSVLSRSQWFVLYITQIYPQTSKGSTQQCAEVFNFFVEVLKNCLIQSSQVTILKTQKMLGEKRKNANLFPGERDRCGRNP